MLPAAAPLESVSQPPDTARQMDPVKSPWDHQASVLVATAYYLKQAEPGLRIAALPSGIV